MFTRITPLGVVMGSIIGLYVFIFLSRITTTLTHKSKYSVYINLVHLIPASMIAYLCFTFSSKYLVVFGYLLFFSLLVDLLYLIFILITRRKKNKVISKIYYLGIIPIILTASMITYGYFNMNNVVETSYSFESNKLSNDYKMALISDTHFGTIQDKRLMEEKANYLSSLNLDLLVLDGDLVDDQTKKEDMESLFRIIGNIKTKYGIYYVYGNHDRQPYEDRRTFTNPDLENNIKLNNISILQDDHTIINNEIVLIGREDKSKKRKSMDNLLDGVDKTKYLLVLDHQPVEIEENSNKGIDLELSGHTHARQIWPIGLAFTIMGTYNYGLYTVNNLNLIVTSGFAGWGYPIRTEKHCEYVIINLKGTK